MASFYSAVGDRIRSRMSELDMDQPELAKRVGCSQSAISQIFTGRTTNSRFLPRIAQELGVSFGWLVGSTEDPSEGAPLMPTSATIAEQLDAVLLPQVEVGLSMGGGSVLDDWPVIQMVPMSRAWLRALTPSAPEHLMVAPGVGDSMMPTILDGDLTIIDRAQNTPRQQDRIWAMVYGGFGMIKRLRALPDGSFQINSDNPTVTPIHAVDGEMQIVGRVVGVVRRI